MHKFAFILLSVLLLATCLEVHAEKSVVDKPQNKVGNSAVGSTGGGSCCSGSGCGSGAKCCGCGPKSEKHSAQVNQKKADTNKASANKANTKNGIKKN